MAAATAYRLRDLRHGYGGPPVLDIADLGFEAGAVTAMVGPNGAGKSTLLGLLAFLEAAGEGRVEFFGEAVAPERLGTLRRRVGLVAQRPYLLRGTVRDNLELGLRLRGIPARERSRRVGAILEQVGIADLGPRPAGSLSGGEAQKAALARALVLEPEVLLLDEPFSFLDQLSIQEIERLVAMANRDHGRTVIFTTHDLVRGQALADRVVSLFAGRTVAASLVNLLRGRSDPAAGIFDTGRLRIAVPPGGGACLTHLAIDPNHLVLSREPLHSSMRNCFPGRVTAIAEEGSRVRVVVEAGERLQAVITHDSLAEQDLGLGTAVWVSFKSTAVELF